MTVFVNIDSLINGTMYDKLKKKYHNIKYKPNALSRAISQIDNDSISQRRERQKKEETNSGSNICYTNKKI